MFDSFRHSDSYNSYVPAVDPVNCSLLGLLNSGIRIVLKTSSHFVLHSGNSPKALWGEPLASAGSSPYPQKWLFFIALCPVLSEWWFSLFRLFLVDSIKRINSTSLTLCWSEVGVLFSLSSTIGYPWFAIKPYQIYYV